MSKIFRLYILLPLFLIAGGFVFADTPTSSLDDKPSVDTAAVVGNQNSSSPAVVPPTPSSADAQASYLYDLKRLIAKSRENIKRVNEKIKEQAVLKRNQKREERAREYYEKGVELTDEGKLNEAREYFEKAIRITEHPEMSGYIRESQSRLKKQEEALRRQENERTGQIKEDESSRRREVEEAYKEAVALYKQKKYHPAKDAFQHVEEIAPDYRATTSYLKIIDEDIIISDAVAAKQQKVEMERQQKEAEAARAKEKEAWRREIEEKEKQRKEQLNAQAQEVYEQAVRLYNAKKFAEAKKKFEEVSWVVPDYKATMNYLRRIDRDAQEEKKRLEEEALRAQKEKLWQETVEHRKEEVRRQQEMEIKEREHRKQLEDQAKFLYQAAIALFDNKAMDEALEKFSDIERICPDFKSTRGYIARIKQWQFEQQQRLLEEQRRQQQEQQHKLELEVNGLYQSALGYYRAFDFQEAKEGFLKVEAKEPDYKFTRKYLSEIDDRINQAQVLYQEAGALFDKKMVDDALEKFNEIQKVYPNFKSTNNYLERIKQEQSQQHHAMEAQTRRQQERRQLELEANDMYIAALKYYRAGNTDAAREEFLRVSARVPNYELTNKYLSQLGVKMPPAPIQPQAPEESVVVPPPVSVVPVTSPVEDQQQQARDIVALAQKSAQLYRQIADIANDKTTIAVKRKMAQVDEIINNIKGQQERLLRQMHQEEWLKQQQEAKAKQERRRSEAEKMYGDALELLRDRQYEKAKMKLEALERFSPDYKATRQYLSRIDQEQKRADLQAMAQAEKTRADRLKQLQEKEQIEAKRRLAQEEDQQRALEQKQQTQLAQLAFKASEINDDIIRLSKEQNYEAMKRRFEELESTVSALTALKDAMAQAKDRQNRGKQLAQEDLRRHNKEIQAYAPPVKLPSAALSGQPNTADQYKRREVMREQAMLFSEAVDCYRHKKYTQAQLLFGELANQHDRRAEAWLKKVDRAVSEEVLKAKQAQEREQTAFIADQLRAERKLRLMQEQEGQRQKKLREELERQKRLYEEDRLLQRQKQETMKAQERERKFGRMRHPELDSEEREAYCDIGRKAYGLMEEFAAEAGRRRPVIAHPRLPRMQQVLCHSLVYRVVEEQQLGRLDRNELEDHEQCRNGHRDKQFFPCEFVRLQHVLDVLSLKHRARYQACERDDDAESVKIFRPAKRHSHTVLVDDEEVVEEHVLRLRHSHCFQCIFGAHDDGHTVYVEARVENDSVAVVPLHVPQQFLIEAVLLSDHLRPC